jgi:hypothetical protein
MSVKVAIVENGIIKNIYHVIRDKLFVIKNKAFIEIPFDQLSDYLQNYCNYYPDEFRENSLIRYSQSTKNFTELEDLKTGVLLLNE